MKIPPDISPELLEEMLQRIKSMSTKDLRRVIELDEEDSSNRTNQADLDAGNNLYELCLQAETREEFLLYLEATDAIGFLTKPIRVVLTLLKDGNPIKDQAIRFNIIRKKDDETRHSERS